MSTGVKSDKTFEEIVERLVAFFRLKPRPGERDDEELIEIDSTPRHSRHTKIPSDPKKNKK